MRLALTRGLEVEIDEADYPIVRGLKWYAWKSSRGTKFYAAANTQLPSGRKTVVLMHRLLLNFPPSLIDHVDRNGLNNRRANLRLASQSENQANAGRRRDNTSGYKGVSRLKSGRWGAWIARGAACGSRYLGSFDTPEEAACAYDAAARARFKAFALTNAEIE